EPGSYRRELVVPRFPPRPVTLRNRGGILLLPRAPTGGPRRLAPRHRGDLARPGTNPRDSRPTDASSPPPTNRADRRPRGVGTLQRDPVGRARHRPYRPGPTGSRSIPLVRGARFNRRVHQPRRGAASSPRDRLAVPSPARNVLPHAAGNLSLRVLLQADQAGQLHLFLRQLLASEEQMHRRSDRERLGGPRQPAPAVGQRVVLCGRGPARPGLHPGDAEVPALETLLPV